MRTVVADDDLVSLPDAVLATEPSLPAASAAPTDSHGLAAVDEREAPPGGGRVVVVWGPAGAPGRTTVAVGIAAELARRQARTTLVDADPYGGSVAQVLGILDEVSGLLAAARLAGAGALEERFDSVQRALDPWLTVVTGLPRPDRWTEVRAGTVEALLEVASTQGHVVVDTGFSLEEDPGGDYGARPGRNQMTLAALAVADEIVVVGNADPVGLSRLGRALVDLQEAAGAVPVRVVVNRMRPSLGWTERDITDMVTGFTRPVGLHFLPDDRGVVDRALVSGRMLLETNSDAPLVKAIADLADTVAPRTDTASAGWSARLRRRTAG